MKKRILTIFGILFILSACSQNPNKITEETASENMENFNESEVVSMVNAINDGLTPKIKPTGSTTSSSSEDTSQQQAQQQAQQQETINNNLEENNMQQEQTNNLVEQYSGAILKTNQGNIEVKFYGEDSPVTVNNFLKLAQNEFYNGTKFHRVIKDFMIQGGCPNSKDDDRSNDGTGGPGYTFKDEFNDHLLVRGSLAMANSGADTNGSQFFIVTAESTPWLDGAHTNFGEVVSGMDVVNKIENMEVNADNHPLEDATVESIELIAKENNSTVMGSELPEKIETQDEILDTAEEDIDF